MCSTTQEKSALSISSTHNLSCIRTKTPYPVSATPFRGGSATLNPPLGHSKVREKKSIFVFFYGSSKAPTPVSATPTHTLRVCVNSREVRRSPTWHSSESESALERFEPVAVVMLQSDGRGTLFALVAARRQGRDI